MANKEAPSRSQEVEGRGQGDQDLGYLSISTSTSPPPFLHHNQIDPDLLLSHISEQSCWQHGGLLGGHGQRQARGTELRVTTKMELRGLAEATGGVGRGWDGLQQRRQGEEQRHKVVLGGGIPQQRNSPIEFGLSISGA